MSHIFAPVINDPKTVFLQNSENAKSTTDIPGDDVLVRLQLTQLGHAAALSGEGNQERRARLIAIMNEANEDEDMGESQDSDNASEDDEEFYTPGSEELEVARRHILESSILRASRRTAFQKRQAQFHDFTKVLKHRRNIAHKLNQYALTGSYTIQDNQRMLSRVRFNCTEDLIGCSSWEGFFSVLKKDETGFYQETFRLAQGFHSEMATIAWSPRERNVIVSGGAEGNMHVWKIPDKSEKVTRAENMQKSAIYPEASATEAHSKRIAQLGFHPTGDYFATTSYDQTWKLWDVNRPESELLEQEGHSKEVFSMSFHPDGSLIATGGLDAIGLLWDLRSGRSVASFQGHVKGIYSMDFSPNGYHLATGSGDNSVKIWDLRRGRGAELFSIPAHTKIVSDVRFLKGADSLKATRSAESEGNREEETMGNRQVLDSGNEGYLNGCDVEGGLSSEVTDENGLNPEPLSVLGTCLVTSSYDNTVKVWSADNWVKIKTLEGHTDKVLSCDISSDGSEIVSCGWDRTLRTWGVEEV